MQRFKLIEMRLSITLFSSILLFSLPSCKKKGCTDPEALNFDAEAKKNNGTCFYAPPQEKGITFSFSHRVNGSAFIFDSLENPHPSGYLYSIETVKYFISNLALHRDSGDSIYIDVAHYVDAEDGNTTKLKWLESIPDGTYTGVSFVFGLDEGKNISGLFVNPPQSLMIWPESMGGGYHYMKLEGRYDAGGSIEMYNTHTGAAFGVPYHFWVHLPQTFTVVDNHVNIELLMEMNNWYQNPNAYDFAVYGAGIMDNPTAQQALKENGIDVFSLGTIE